MALQNISNKHRLMMESEVFDGLTPREISVKHDISETRLSIIRRSPLWVLEVKELRATYLLDRKKEMENLLPAAIQTLARNLNCPNPATQVTASKAILDRAGMPANLVVVEENPMETEAMYDTLESIRDEKAAILAELGVDSVDDLIDVEATHTEELNDLNG